MSVCGGDIRLICPWWDEPDALRRACRGELKIVWECRCTFPGGQWCHCGKCHVCGKPLSLKKEACHDAL